MTRAVRTRHLPHLIGCLAMVAAATLVGCGDSGGTSEPATNPLPVLLSVTPTQLVAGTGATTLTLSGSGFIPASRARWNDGDRVTRYRDPQSLTVELLATDVDSLTNGKLTVVNGGPGGGISGSVTVAVGYPQPRITAVSPSVVALQSNDASLTLTITGSGFVSASTLRLGTDFVAITSATPTQIVAILPGFFFSTPGIRTLAVVNPTPGGGTSNAVDLAVNYPVPTISSVSPDSAFTGAPFTLTVNGSGFARGSTVRWNGTALSTSFVSESRLTATVTTGEVAGATTASVTVFNPSPGGGASNAVSLRVAERAPLIAAVSPGIIQAGSGATLVSVTGTDFAPGATAQWNGATRASTLLSSTSMRITLLASDVTSPAVGRITVTNPGTSGVSNAMAIAVVAAGATLSRIRTIPLTHADLVWDASRAVLYAAVPSTAPQYTNSVVRVDPASGAITGSVAVGSDPDVLAITDDDQFLYVGLRGAPSVVRLALTTFSRDIDITLPSDGFSGVSYAEDIVSLPGRPQSIVVSTYYTGLSPRNAGTFIYDNATRRRNGGQGHTGANRITRGVNAARVYGYNNETTEFGFRSLLVTADGLQEESVRGGLIAAFGADIESSDGRVYATTGDVIDAGSMSKLGRVPIGGIVWPDAANARVHYYTSGTLRTYHYTTFANLGSWGDSSLGSHTRLIRWGADGLALGGGSAIVLLRGALVAP